MYPYKTPPGAGDIFFQYIFDAQNARLTDGNDYQQLGVQINNGQFMHRFWSGLTSVADGLTIYDWLNRRQSASAMLLGIPSASDKRWAQMVVAPETLYPNNNGQIRFDLENVHQTLVGTDGGLSIYASQLAFSGIRRQEGYKNDPIPANYKYYEKPFWIPYTLSIANYASAGGVFLPPVQNQILIEDYDFELRRIELQIRDDDDTPPFKILLYDSNKVQRANLPVLSNLLCHLNEFVGGNQGNPTLSNGELNSWPSPPIVYPIGSTIRFDISSLLMSPVSLPRTYEMLFNGVRRIPCL